MTKTYTFSTPKGATITMTISIDDYGDYHAASATSDNLPAGMTPRAYIKDSLADAWIVLGTYGKQDIMAAIPQDIMADIKSTAAAVKAESKAATVSFYVTGWEAHLVYVDTRKDIDEQLARIAAQYACDGCSLESVREAYNKTLAQAAKKADAKKAEAARIEALKQTARQTGQPQVLRTYMDECNEPDDFGCDLDEITEYIMPDGSIEIERIHTF